MEVKGKTTAVQSQTRGASKRTWHLAPTGSSPVLHLQLGWQVLFAHACSKVSQISDLDSAITTAPERSG